MDRRLLAAAVLLAGLAPTLAPGAPVDAVRAGDMQQMIPEIIAIYENAGLSWDHGIDWKVGPFTTTFWYYDPINDDIQAGAVPTDAEIEAYWQTWSDVLTDGNFAPAGFFASPAEARELAYYNQFVLATHESAHAITFRYDYNHLSRHDYDINCREYYADRLTVTILNEQAWLDPDMARWRARYLDLVTAMGETIPEQYRYRIPDFATLDADCAVIEVAQPTPETMQPYASAYFERYRVLLEADLPPMATVFETHLGAYHDRKLANLPLDPDRDRYTLATRQAPVASAFPGGGREDAMTRTRAAAFGPDGTLYFATVGYDAETRQITFEFGTDPAASPPLGPPEEWPRPSRRLDISSLAVLSPERFFIALQHWEFAEGSTEESVRFVSWIRAERRDGTWSLDLVGELDGMESAVVLRGPDDRLYILAAPGYVSSLSPSLDWRGLEIAPATGDVLAELTINSAIGVPFAIDAEGRLYDPRLDTIWRHTPEGASTVLVGVDLQGLRDGPLATAEIIAPDAMQWLADGTALIFDHTPGYAAWAIRELRAVE